MSLKEIPLDPFLLAQLYQAPIISEKKKRRKEEVSVPNVKGGNKKGIIILTHKEEEEKLNQFLENILKACHLGMNDVALMDVAQWENEEWTEVFHSLSTQKILCFGDYFKQYFEGEYKKNEEKKWNKIPCLLTDSLGSLYSDPALKKNLWQALQKFFNLK